MTYDVEYLDNGFYVKFFPNTKEGEYLCEVIASQDKDGFYCVESRHKRATLKQIRDAGYTVAKAKPVKMTDEQLLAELEI